MPYLVLEHNVGKLSFTTLERRASFWRCAGLVGDMAAALRCAGEGCSDKRADSIIIEIDHADGMDLFSARSISDSEAQARKIVKRVRANAADCTLTFEMDQLRRSIASGHRDAVWQERARAELARLVAMVELAEAA